MVAIFDLLYREYCRARLAEMRRQLLISPKRHAAPEAPSYAGDAFGASPTDDGEAPLPQPFGRVNCAKAQIRKPTGREPAGLITQRAKSGGLSAHAVEGGDCASTGFVSLERSNPPVL
jgi:hypothetical protein